MKRALLVAVILAGIAVISGVIVALNVDLNPINSIGKNESEPRITGLTLGTYSLPTTGSSGQNIFKTKKQYLDTDQLVLRVERDDLSQSVHLSARLKLEDGTIEPLTPSNITIGVEQTEFCCWEIKKPNTYTLQVFKPGGGVSTIPLVVRSDRSSATRSGGGGLLGPQ